MRRLLALLFGLALILPALPAGAANDLQVTVRPGFDGSVRPGNWVPIEINLVNSGPNVSGNVELMVQRRQTAQNGPNAAPVSYAVPVTVPEHSSKRFSTAVYVPPFFDEIAVRLVAGSQTVYNQSFTIQRVDPSQIACGVLSTDPSAFATLGNLQLADGRRQPHLVQLDLPDLPTNPQLLSSLDCLIVSDYSTRGLSALQQSALSTWVDNGGVLAIGTGPTGAGTLSGLPPDLLPATMNGTIAVRSLSSLATYFGGTPDQSGPWLGANLKPTHGVTIVSDESQPLVVVGQRGKGAVFLFALSFTQKPLRGWNGFDHLWNYVLSYVPISASVFNSYYRQEYGWGRMPREALVQSGVGTDDNSRRLLFGLLAFAFLVGPINFLVLARLGRRELSLLTVPLLAGVALGGSLVFASHHQQGDVVLNQVSIVRSWDGRGTGEMHSFVGVYGLHRQQFALQTPANQLLSPSSSPFVGWNRNFTSTRIVDTGASRAPNVELEPGMMSSFIVDGSLAEPGQVQSGLVLQGDQLRGAVKNGLPVALRGVAVIAGSNVQSLGDLSPGASRDVLLHLSPTSPTGTADLAPVFDKLYPNASKSGTLLPQDVKYNILSAALNPSGSYGGAVQTSGVTLIGWIDSPIEPVSDGVAKREASQNLLFITSLPLALGAQPQVIPPQLLEREQLSSSYSARVDATAITVNAGDEAEFQFRAPVDPAHFALRGLTLVSNTNVPIRGTLELYDWRAGAWESVPFQLGALPIPNPDRFVSATGVARLRFRYQPGPSGTPTSVSFTRFQFQIEGSGR